MEIANNMEDYGDLREYINMLFTTNLVCRLKISLEGIRFAVDFFISNWNILKSHFVPVIVGSSVLVGIYRSGSPSINRKFTIMKKFHTSIMTMKACIYDVLRARRVSLTYEFGELPKIIGKNRERLGQC
jgi:hypothetical protein